MADAQTQPKTAGDEAWSSQALDALWERALESWDDGKVHAALLEHALLSESLHELAAHYKHLSADPAKGALATKQLDAIVQAATQMLLSTKMPRPGRVPLPITLSAAGVCLALVAWLAYGLFSHAR
jgi:hypothetical protein